MPLESRHGFFTASPPLPLGSWAEVWVKNDEELLAAVFPCEGGRITGGVHDIEDANARVVWERAVVDEVVRVFGDDEHADAFQRASNWVAGSAHHWIESECGIGCFDLRQNAVGCRLIVHSDVVGDFLHINRQDIGMNVHRGIRHGMR